MAFPTILASDPFGVTFVGSGMPMFTMVCVNVIFADG